MALTITLTLLFLCATGTATYYCRRTGKAEADLGLLRSNQKMNVVPEAALAEAERNQVLLAREVTSMRARLKAADKAAQMSEGKLRALLGQLGLAQGNTKSALEVRDTLEQVKEQITEVSDYIRSPFGQPHRVDEEVSDAELADILAGLPQNAATIPAAGWAGR